RRTRTLSGVLALVAMTFSLAEAGLAATCAMMGSADMGMAMSSEPAEASSMNGSGLTGAAHRAGAHESPAECEDCSQMASGDRDEPEHPCPFGPMMGSGCSAAASVRSPSPVFSGSMVEHGYHMRGQTSSPASRSADRLFHPPRA
ncbi:MAG: hypothetical protein WD995_12680, partial [Gemmatimonadota bacterium]